MRIFCIVKPKNNTVRTKIRLCIMALLLSFSACVTGALLALNASFSPDTNQQAIDAISDSPIFDVIELEFPCRDEKSDTINSSNKIKRATDYNG